MSAFLFLLLHLVGHHHVNKAAKARHVKKVAKARHPAKAKKVAKVAKAQHHHAHRPSVGHHHTTAKK